MKRLLVPALFLPLLSGCGNQAPAPTSPAAAPALPTQQGEGVTYKAGRDTVRALLHRPGGAGPFPAVVVLHSDFGLTRSTNANARRLAQAGYVALAPDLFRGETPKELLDAHIMDRGLPEDRVEADLKAALDYLTGRLDVRGDDVGVLGWDMGGGYALDAATHDQRIKAVVVCYGRLTTDPHLLAPMKASVLGLFAGKDPGIPPETIQSFRAAMSKAGKRVADLYVYPDARPGFLDPPPYLSLNPDPAVVQDAWSRIDAYLSAELKR